MGLVSTVAVCVLQQHYLADIGNADNQIMVFSYENKARITEIFCHDIDFKTLGQSEVGLIYLII